MAKVCSKVEVKDELHFLAHCPKYKEQRMPSSHVQRGSFTEDLMPHTVRSSLSFFKIRERILIGNSLHGSLSLWYICLLHSIILSREVVMPVGREEAPPREMLVLIPPPAQS